MKTYAGIGSRETPGHILTIMKESAILLAIDGFTLSTGAAIGADQTFANGANLAHGFIHLHLPWRSYEEAWRLHMHHSRLFVLQDNDIKAHNSVAVFHPAYEKLTRGPRALHARNYNILTKPIQVQFIICWTPEGDIIGGTGQALRIAQSLNITIYNLGHKETLDAMLVAIQKRRHEVNQFIV